MQSSDFDKSQQVLIRFVWEGTNFYSPVSGTVILYSNPKKFWRALVFRTSNVRIEHEKNKSFLLQSLEYRAKTRPADWELKSHLVQI